MVQTLVNQNSSNLDAQQIEQQILQTQRSIQSDTARLEDWMSLLSVYQNNKRFAWDSLKESEEDHKNLQESFTK
jgi:cytochrome c-type biogenesis protein CcmH/NrfG